MALVLAANACLSAWPVRAQVPAPGAPAAAVQQQINGAGLRSMVMSRIASSGLTPDQVRQRLASLGYDPATLDPYLSADTGAVPEPTAGTLAAARSLGVVEVPAATPAAPAALPAATAEERAELLRVFGLNVFARTTTEFQPLTVGPVPPEYVVGPGDELVLILTGDVEQSYSLPVARDGFVVIPRVGQVWVNGATLGGLREQMYRRLGSVYSGIRRGPGATAHFELTLGRLRTNQVFVTGEVTQPGSYLVSPVASVLNALYVAGGPTASGSFRDVRIVRGGRVAQHVDLYDYMLRGNDLSAIRLEPGDVLFVPTQGPHVALRGQVRRPAIYEMAPGETLYQLLQNAGGVTAPAYVGRARISRVLPPEERREPGVDRTVLDVGLAEVLRDSTRAPVLRDGDDVTVFAVRDEVRNVVSVDGAVWHPGTFGFRPGMRAWDLIRVADGLTPSAYLAQAQIVRLDPRDSTLSIVTFALDTATGGAPASDPELTEYDALTVFDVTLRAGFDVSLTGEVYRDVRSPYQEGMTLRDLVVRAGGLRPSADLTLEVARFASQAERERGVTARVVQVRIDSTAIVSEEAARHYLGYPDSLRARVAGEGWGAFRIEPYDQVLVRRLAAFVTPRSVTVRGQVRHPGQYTLLSRTERLRDVLERAGGLTDYAYAEGFRFVRDGRPLNVELPRVLRDAGHRDNVVVAAGDSLIVPEYDPTVTVTGAVNSPTAVLYRPGAGLGYYVANAGGYASNADPGRTHVRYANGEGRVARSRFFLLPDYHPTPGPGSTVTVPALAREDRFDLRGFLTDMVQILGSVTTVVVLLTR